MKKQAIHLIGVLTIASMAAAPAQAQFGGLFKKKTPPTTEQSDNSDSGDNGGCPQGKKGNRAGRAVLGGVLSGVLGSTVGRTGMGSFIPISAVAGTLTDAIACRLDEGEQQQAAAATDEVTRGEKVGTTSSWKSDTREGVSGSSTVIARNDEAGGRRCIDVTDFIIVNGEETRATKRMCREPGQARYQIAAA